MKILLLAIITLNSIPGYGQFDGLKKDTSVTARKTNPATYPGVKEIKPREPLFKSEDVQLFRQRANTFRLLFTWYNLKSNEEEQLNIDFGKTDIMDLINILEATISRSDDCEFKTKQFHVGRLGQRVVFFRSGGYANISDEAARQLVSFLKTLSPV